MTNLKNKIFLSSPQIPWDMNGNKLACASCGKSITNDPGNAQFKCPQCGKQEIVRCLHCRKIAAKYKCPECDFVGPN